MTEISNKALARRKLFLENKSKNMVVAGQPLPKETVSPPPPAPLPILERDWVLYHADNGDIVCFSQEDPAIREGWRKTNFTQAVLKQLVGQDLNKWWVRPSHPPVLHMKPLKTVEIDTYVEFTTQKSKKFDISFEITETSLIIKMNKKTKKQFADMYPISASKNGYRLLKFYVAENIDPYFVYAEITVPLSELITEEFIVYPLPVDLQKHAVYGSPIFEKNVRVT